MGTRVNYTVEVIAIMELGRSGPKAATEPSRRGLRRRVAAAFALVAASAACDTTAMPTDLDVAPAFVVTENDNLTNEEEAELRLRAKIVNYDLVPMPDGWGPGAPMIVWTDASIPFGIFHPRIKHDVQYQVTTNGQTQTPHMLPGDYEIQLDGLRMDFPSTGLNCDQVDSGQIWAESQHSARWRYFKLGSVFHIDDGPLGRSRTASCPPRQTIVPGGDVGHPTEDGQQWCLVEITYNPATGQILGVEVLFCW